MPIKPLEADVKAFGKLLRMGTADVQDLVRKGVIIVKPDGHIDTAQSLVAVAQHLVATRSVAEAKARAAEADAQIKEHRLRAAAKADEQTEPVKVRKGGKWSKAAGDRICAAIENGKSLRAAAKAEGITAAGVLKWIKRFPEWGKQYARACETRHQLYADEIDDILDEADRAALDPVSGSQRLTALRLRIDTRKWQLSKVLPKVYGDRTQMVIEGANPADLLPKHTAEQDSAFLRMLADIQAKTPPPPDRTQNNE